MHHHDTDSANPSATTPRGIGGRYHRVSTTRQDTDRQVQDIDRWLSAKGLSTSQTWEDHDSRDKAEQRYDFQRMLGAVRSRAVDWIVIQSIDRFGFKDTYEFFSFVDTFRANNVQLWSASDNACISHSDDARILLNAIAGLTSSKEQIEKANRIQTARFKGAKDGRYLGGLPPYGLDVVCRWPTGREKWRYVLD